MGVRENEVVVPLPARRAVTRIGRKPSMREGPHDRVPDVDAVLGRHPQVQAGTGVRDQQCRHLRDAEADPDAAAGHPGLADLELGPADAEPVADAHLVVGQALDGEVLAEVPRGEVAPAEHPTAVRTVRPRQTTSRGRPTSIDSSRPITSRPVAASPGWGCAGRPGS